MADLSPAALRVAANVLANLSTVREPLLYADALDLLADGKLSAARLADKGWHERRARRVVACLVRDLRLQPVPGPHRHNEKPYVLAAT